VPGVSAAVGGNDATSTMQALITMAITPSDVDNLKTQGPFSTSGATVT